MATAAIQPAAPIDVAHLPSRDDTTATAPLSPTSQGSPERWKDTQPDVRLHCEDFGIPKTLMAQLQADCNTTTVDIMPYEDFIKLVADVLACTPDEDIQAEVSRRVQAQTRHRRSQLRDKEWRFSRDPLVREHGQARVLCLPVYKDSLYSHWDFIKTAKDTIMCQLQVQRRSRQIQPKIKKAPRRSQRIRAQRASTKK